MFQVPQQISALAQSQMEAQLRFIDTFTSKAFDSAEKIIALQFTAGRSLLDSGTAAARQLLNARMPGELFPSVTTAAAAAKPTPAPITPKASAEVAHTAAPLAPTSAPAVQAVAPVAPAAPIAPVAVAVAVAKPAVKAKPIAKAVADLADKTEKKSADRPAQASLTLASADVAAEAPAAKPIAVAPLALGRAAKAPAVKTAPAATVTPVPPARPASQAKGKDMQAKPAAAKAKPAAVVPPKPASPQSAKGQARK